TYPIENLWGGAVDSVAAGTDTISATAANGGNGYASLNPPSGGMPVTITLDFSAAQELSALYLWNASGGGLVTPPKHGIKQFDLLFFDGAAGTGTQLGSQIDLQASQAPQTGDYAAEAFTFASVAGVRSAQLIIDSNQLADGSWVGAREIGFEAVGADPPPPPSEPFVQPDSATTDGGSYGGTYLIENLWNEGVTTATDTISANTANSGNGYASAEPPTAGYPVTITMNFTSPQDLNAFCLWNGSGGGFIGPVERGIKQFDLKFFDGADGSGNQIGTTFSDTALSAPQTGDYAAEVFTFPSTNSGIQSVQLVINSNQIDDSGTWTGIRELGFKGQSSPNTDGSRIVVYLVGGQSNADGYGNPADLSTELVAPLEDVLFYHGNGGGNSPLTADTWIALQVGSGSMPANAGYFGTEFGFGHEIHNKLGSEKTTIAIIKHTKGATKLYSDWVPGGDASTTGDGPIYQAFQSTVNAGLAALAAQYPESIIQIEGMLWHQGEGDVNDGQHLAYESNLTTFIADVRATYESNLRFGIVQLSDNQGLEPTKLAVVKQAQANVAAADPLSYLVTTDDLPTIPGAIIHFGADSQLTIGSRLVTGMLQLPLTDADGNGIDDDWEVLYWGAAGQDAAGNPDLDVYTNLEEFLLDTSPLVSNVFQAGIALETEFTGLSWIGSTDRRYMIEQSYDLGTWFNLESFIPGDTSGTNSYPLLEVLSEEKAFFRIRVQR
ncbi:MAG: hypothetical protein KAU94_09880, partial [Verrucomicrobia bacterium]|nr:hypothetical protein [Verrucomicrobiota bacterium]